MNTLVKLSLIFGLVGFLACTANFLLTRALGLNPLVEFRLVDVPIVIVAIIGAIVFFRYFVASNELHLWQGITIGFFVFIVIVNLYGLFIFVFLEYYDPSLLIPYIQALQTEQLKFKTEIMSQLSMTEEVFMKDRVLALNNTRPKDIAINEMVRKILMPIPFFNIIIIFISSLYLRKINK